MKKKSLNKKLALKKEVIALVRGGGKPVDALGHGNGGGGGGSQVSSCACPNPPPPPL